MNPTQATPAPGLLSPDQAAAYLGLSPATLENWRQDGKGPAHVRLSHKCVRYRQAALDAWVASLEVPAAHQ